VGGGIREQYRSSEMLAERSSRDLAELGQSPKEHERQSPAHRKHLAIRQSTAGPGDNCRQVFERVALTAHRQVTTVELVQKCARVTTPMTEAQPQIAVPENQFRSACRLPCQEHSAHTAIRQHNRCHQLGLRPTGVMSAGPNNHGDRCERRT
jgi:hypothetical protein